MQSNYIRYGRRLLVGGIGDGRTSGVSVGTLVYPAEIIAWELVLGEDLLSSALEQETH